MHSNINKSAQHDISAEVNRLKAEMRAITPNNPSTLCPAIKYFRKWMKMVLSRTLLNLLPEGSSSQTAIEMGCGDGLENDTHSLLLAGFRICWLDGSPTNIAFIGSELGFVGDHKGPAPWSQVISSPEITFAKFSADFPDFFRRRNRTYFRWTWMRGNDLHVLDRALSVLQPKIICVEYNGKFPPPLKLTVGVRNPNHQWSGDDLSGRFAAGLFRSAVRIFPRLL